MMRASRLVLVLGLAACATQSAASLAAGLHGIPRAEFITCAGPPILSYSSAGQEHLAFLANRAPPGTIGSNAFLPGACSGNAVFENGKLVAVEFRGSPALCNQLFASCRQR